MIIRTKMGIIKEVTEIKEAKTEGKIRIKIQTLKRRRGITIKLKKSQGHQQVLQLKWKAMKVTRNEVISDKDD